jgi:uncharacterized protein (TIGR02145 family)
MTFMYIFTHIAKIYLIFEAELRGIRPNEIKIIKINVTDNPNIVIDVDGNIYNTVTIGTQVWMKENLRTTKYNDNTAIPIVTDGSTWAGLITPAYCWYNNDAATYKNTYGALYNWNTVQTEKLCPIDWHVPSDDEWTTLTDYLGGESVAGNKLKETGITHWMNPNSGATNETVFTALPGGSRHLDGTFNDVGNYGSWWSATEYSAYYSWSRYMYYNTGDVSRSYYGGDKLRGLSVRCVKD